MTLRVELVSPERILHSGDADMVICRTVGDGEVAFLTGHAPFIGSLDIDAVRVLSDGEDEVAVAVHGGFVEVSNDRVTILSDVAELQDQIDVARAESARDRAKASDADDEGAAAALKRADVRVRVATESGQRT